MVILVELATFCIVVFENYLQQSVSTSYRNVLLES